MPGRISSPNPGSGSDGCFATLSEILDEDGGVEGQRDKKHVTPQGDPPSVDPNGGLCHCGVATIRKLMQRDEAEYEEENSWDDIADEVQVVLNKLDIYWPPTPHSSPSGNDKRRRGSEDANGSDHEDADIDLPPSKKAKGDDDKDKGKTNGKKGSKGGKGKGKGEEPEPGPEQDEGLSKKDERAQANAARLDAIVRYVHILPKGGADSLWRRAVDYKNKDHRTEENLALARLLQGYTKVSTADLDRWFGDIVRKDGRFKVQIDDHMRANETEDDMERMENWHKSLNIYESKSRVHDLVQNVLSMITQIQMAEEWGRQNQAWKSKYLTESFRSIKEKEIRNAQHSMAGKEYESWFNESRARFRDLEQKTLTSRNWTLSLYKEFGSIVLLDSRWNPKRYGKDQHSEGFGSFIRHFLSTMPHRYARGTEADEYPEELEYDGDRALVKRHYGQEADNDRTVVEIVRFITGDDAVADYVSGFIKQRQTKLGKRAIRQEVNGE